MFHFVLLLLIFLNRFFVKLKEIKTMYRLLTLTNYIIKKPDETNTFTVIFSFDTFFEILT